MKNYNYILLDWDGCLAKTLDICLQTYKSVFAEYGVYPDDRFITHNIFVSWDGMEETIPDQETFSKKFLERIKSIYPNAQLYENVRMTLEQLRNQKKKLALVTSCEKSLLGPVLTNQKLNHFFDVILTADDVSKHKPDPEIVFKAIQMLNGNLNESIIIGDSVGDLGAAKNAKIDSLLFYPKHNEKFYDIEFLKKHNPTYIVKDFRNILDYIK